MERDRSRRFLSGESLKRMLRVNRDKGKNNSDHNEQYACP